MITYNSYCAPCVQLKKKKKDSHLNKAKELATVILANLNILLLKQRLI